MSGRINKNLANNDVKKNHLIFLIRYVLKILILLTEFKLTQKVKLKVCCGPMVVADTTRNLLICDGFLVTFSETVTDRVPSMTVSLIRHRNCHVSAKCEWAPKQ